MTVLTNDKWRCRGCGGIFHFDSVAQMRECPTCEDIDYEQIVIAETCDFCGVNDPGVVVGEVPCGDFSLCNGGLLPDQQFSGAWAVCADCSRDVAANARQELALRAVRIAVEKDPGMQVIADILLEEITKLHILFFDHMTGPPVAYDPEEVS